MITLLGTVKEKVPEYAATKPPAERQKIEYAAAKVERDMLQLFGTLKYDRTRQELDRLKEFVTRSRFYVLGPRDDETARKLEEEERAWLEEAG